MTYAKFLVFIPNVLYNSETIVVNLYEVVNMYDIGIRILL